MKGVLTFSRRIRMEVLYAVGTRALGFWSNYGSIAFQLDCPWAS